MVDQIQLWKPFFEHNGVVVKELMAVPLFAEKGQIDTAEIARVVLMVVVLSWVGWMIAPREIQQRVIQLAPIIIVILIIVGIIGFFVYLFLFTDVFTSKKEEGRAIEAKKIPHS